MSKDDRTILESRALAWFGGPLIGAHAVADCGEVLVDLRLDERAYDRNPDGAVVVALSERMIRDMLTMVLRHKDDVMDDEIITGVHQTPRQYVEDT